MGGHPGARGWGVIRFSDNNEADFEEWATEQAAPDCAAHIAEDERRRANRERMRRLRASRDPED